MNSKEKIKKALQHQAGPVPVDIGAAPTTGVHVSIVEKLREYFGLEMRPVKVWEPYQMLGEIDDDLVEAIGIDTIGMPAPHTLFGFAVDDWKLWETPWGQEVFVPGQFTVTKDENGYYIYPQGDINAPPSGHLPNTGYFFDTIVRQEPIDENTLDPEDNLEEFGPYSDDVLSYYKKQSDRLKNSGKAVVATFPGTAFGDIALVPAPFLKYPKGIRDISEWYMSTVTRQEYIHIIFEKQLEYALANLEKAYQFVGDAVDVIFVCGTDFGGQQNLFCSVDTYNNLWKPYYKELNNWVHRNTPWKTFKHSCGSIVDLIDPLIDSGFDILNPVQCSAAGMDPQAIKKRFGERIVFWGGGVDTQHTLPFGTVEEVRTQVLKRCEIFSENGGFVFNTIHNIQACTPVQNLIAMFDAVREFNGNSNVL